MRILGIDPGYDRCGIAILEKTSGKEKLLASTCVETNARAPFIERLAEVVQGVDEHVRTYAPQALAIETLIFNNNQKTALRVAEVRGAIMHHAYARGLTVHEYSPQQIKSAVAGSGRGSKTDITRMVHVLLALPAKKRRDDEYDAIAIALTHSAIHRTE